MQRRSGDHRHRARRATSDAGDRHGERKVIRQALSRSWSCCFRRKTSSWTRTARFRCVNVAFFKRYLTLECLQRLWLERNRMIAGKAGIWSVAFNGKMVPLVESDGLCYVATLIDHPNQLLGCLAIKYLAGLATEENLFEARQKAATAAAKEEAEDPSGRRVSIGQGEPVRAKMDRNTKKDIERTLAKCGAASLRFTPEEQKAATRRAKSWRSRKQERIEQQQERISRFWRCTQKKLGRAAECFARIREPRGQALPRRRV